MDFITRMEEYRPRQNYKPNRLSSDVQSFRKTGPEQETFLRFYWLESSEKDKSRRAKSQKKAKNNKLISRRKIIVQTIILKKTSLSLDWSSGNTRHQNLADALRFGRFVLSNMMFRSDLDSSHFTIRTRHHTLHNSLTESTSEKRFMFACVSNQTLCAK